MEEGLEEKISLKEFEYKKKKKINNRDLKYKVSLSKDKLYLYIHSEELKIPEYEGEVKLSIAEGIKGILGGTKEPLRSCPTA